MTTYPTFYPVMNPSVGSGPTWKPRLITNTFGDGYRQTAPDGLNTNPMTFMLTWDMLEISDAQAIEGFFIDSIGIPFWWTPPRYTQLLFDCSEWTRTAVSGAQDKITATFVQRWDLS